MSQFIATYANTLLLVKQVNGRFHIEKKLEGMNPIAIAQDPFNPDILYCARLIAVCGKAWTKAIHGYLLAHALRIIVLLKSKTFL